MSDFQREEDLLRRALQRREPRDGFAGRVLARLDEPRQPASPWWRWLWSPALALAVLLVLVAGAWQYQRIEAERVRRVRAEVALQQLQQAMQITTAKLEFASSRVFQAAEEGR